MCSVDWLQLSSDKPPSPEHLSFPSPPPEKPPCSFSFVLFVNFLQLLSSARRHAAFHSTVQQITFRPVSIQSPRPVIGNIQSFLCSQEGFITTRFQWGSWWPDASSCSSGVCCTRSIVPNLSCRVSDCLTHLRSCHGPEPPSSVLWP